MESKKNTPPKGVIIAVAVIAALIIFYLIITAVFPELFHGMDTGKIDPVK